MSEWFTTTAGLYRQLWQRLGRGVADRHAAARHPTFCTVTPDGWPEARTVVLRGINAEAGTLDLHTDITSTKIASLQANPKAGLHVWDDSMRFQIRLHLRVAILTGEAVAEIWARVPDPSRQSYGIVPPPGTPIETALAYRKQADASTFAVLRCTVEKADLLHLGDVHRRATFMRADGWEGQWVAP